MGEIGERIQELAAPALDVIRTTTGKELWTPETANTNRLGDPQAFLRDMVAAGVKTTIMQDTSERGAQEGTENSKPYREISTQPKANGDFLKSHRTDIVAVPRNGRLLPGVLLSRPGEANIRVGVLAGANDTLGPDGIITEGVAVKLQHLLVQEDETDGRYHGHEAGSAGNAAHFGVGIGTALNPTWDSPHDVVHALVGEDAKDGRAGFSTGIAKAGLHDLTGNKQYKPQDVVHNPKEVYWHPGFIGVLDKIDPELAALQPVDVVAAVYYGSAKKRYELDGRSGKLNSVIAGSLKLVEGRR